MFKKTKQAKNTNKNTQFIHARLSFLELYIKINVHRKLSLDLISRNVMT